MLQPSVSEMKGEGRENVRIPVAVSACLLGEKVRYDGGHKLNSIITGTLSRYFEFVPLCPEVAVGLGIPRPPIQLVQSDGRIRVRGVEDSSLDPTEKLVAYGRTTAAQLTSICGYILKSRSPSCGVESTPVFDEAGNQLNTGSGIYAKAIMEANPSLPVIEEEQLSDAVMREDFLSRVTAYHHEQGVQATE